MFQKINKTITSLLFFLYMILLVWIIIFKLETDISYFLATRNYRIVNLQPYLYMNPIEIFLNILVFIPFGIYFKMLTKNISSISIIFLAFALSITFEISQYIFAIGTTDITDVIDNTLGAIIGVIIYKIMAYILEKDTSVILNILSIIIMTLFFLIIRNYI